MKQIQFYFMCLLLTLSMHTVYSSELARPIFATDTIFNTQTGLTLIAIPTKLIQDLRLLKFEQEISDRDQFDWLIVSYQNYTQCLCIGTASGEGEIYTNNPRITPIQGSNVPGFQFDFAYKPRPQPKQ